MIREAKIEDLDTLLAIYNDGIMTGTASFEERPLTEAEGVGGLIAIKVDFYYWFLKRNLTYWVM
jgi:L-amino acid N-acyltransferase YncA